MCNNYEITHYKHATGYFVRKGLVCAAFLQPTTAALHHHQPSMPHTDIPCTTWDAAVSQKVGLGRYIGGRTFHQVRELAYPLSPACILPFIHCRTSANTYLQEQDTIVFELPAS